MQTNPPWPRYNKDGGRPPARCISICERYPMRNHCQDPGPAAEPGAGRCAGRAAACWPPWATRCTARPWTPGAWRTTIARRPGRPRLHPHRPAAPAVPGRGSGGGGPPLCAAQRHRPPSPSCGRRSTTCAPAAWTRAAATITQQVAKNLFFTQEKRFTPPRSRRYSWLSAWRNACTKDEILELYVNTIYFGGRLLRHP